MDTILKPSTMVKSLTLNYKVATVTGNSQTLREGDNSCSSGIRVSIEIYIFFLSPISKYNIYRFYIDGDHSRFGDGMYGRSTRSGWHLSLSIFWRGQSWHEPQIGFRNYFSMKNKEILNEFKSKLRLIFEAFFCFSGLGL